MKIRLENLTWPSVNDGALGGLSTCQVATFADGLLFSGRRISQAAPPTAAHIAWLSFMLVDHQQGAFALEVGDFELDDATAAGQRKPAIEAHRPCREA